MPEEIREYVDNYICIHIVELVPSVKELFPEADEEQVYQYVKTTYGIDLRECEQRPEYQPGESTGDISADSDLED